MSLSTESAAVLLSFRYPSFRFNLKFARTEKALYIGQRVHKKSNKKRRSEQQWKDRVNVPSIPTTWKVLFSKLTSEIIKYE